MGVSPLAFNQTDFNRVVIRIGRLPKSVLTGKGSVYEYWKEYIKTNEDEDIKNNNFLIKATNKLDKKLKEVENDFDEFVNTTIADNKERTPDKRWILSIQNTRNWDENGVLHYLTAECRPKRLTLLVEDDNITKIPQTARFSLFGNAGCFIIGKLKKAEREFLEEKTVFGSSPKLRNLLNPGRSEWSMHFPMAIKNKAKQGIYIYKGLKLKKHIV